MLQRDFIAELPEEIAERILSYLDFRSLATCERVSRGWLARIQIRPVWRSLVQRTILNVESWRLLLARRPGSLPPLLGPSHQWKETFRSYHENLETVRAAWRSQPPKESTIDCRGNGIYCLQYDDEKIISGSRDQTIKVGPPTAGFCVRADSFVCQRGTRCPGSKLPRARLPFHLRAPPDVPWVPRRARVSSDRYGTSTATAVSSS